MAISHSNTITPSPLFPSKKGVLELVTLKIIRTSAFPYSLLNGLIVVSRKIVCEGTKFSENSRYNNSSSLKIMTHILKNLFKEPFELAFKWKLGLLLQVILHLYVTIIGSFFGSVHSRFSLNFVQVLLVVSFMSKCALVLLINLVIDDYLIVSKYLYLF